MWMAQVVVVVVDVDGAGCCCSLYVARGYELLLLSMWMAQVVVVVHTWHAAVVVVAMWMAQVVVVYTLHAATNRCCCRCGWRRLLLLSCDATPDATA